MSIAERGAISMTFETYVGTRLVKLGPRQKLVTVGVIVVKTVIV